MTKSLVPRKTEHSTALLAKPTIVLNLILDESGSMQSVRDKTVEGINEYLGGLLDDPNADYLATLTKFDAHPGDPNCRLQYSMRPLKAVGPMNLSDYNPRGSTPLLDAVGSTIRGVEKEVGDHAVLTIIITDGFENASMEFSKEQIQALVKEKQATGKWTFVFLGADQDAWANSASMGIPKGNTMSYKSANTASAYAAMANVTMARAGFYRSTGLSATRSAFSDAGIHSIDDLDTPPSYTAISDMARRAGYARADKQTADERKALAQKAARARWSKVDRT